MRSAEQNGPPVSVLADGTHAAAFEVAKSVTANPPSAEALHAFPTYHL